MKVKELISALMKLDKNSEILVSIDEEGNDFKKIDEIGVEDPKAREKRYIIFPFG